MPSRPIQSQPPVPLTGTGSFGRGLTVDITSIKRINAQAQGVGEISGPAFAVTLAITNGTPAPIDLSTTTVDLQDGAKTPAGQISSAPAKAFSGELRPKAIATATYVFTIPPSFENPITVTVLYQATAPVVLLTGRAP